MTFIVAFTGHRPDELGGYGDVNPTRDALKEQLATHLRFYMGQALHGDEQFKDLRCISGMALGFDQWAAEVCIALKIPFTAALPFEGHDSIWPKAAQDHCRKLLESADRIECITDGPFAAWKMHKRNEWMVDHANLIIAAWNGDQTGGTAETVKYAMKTGKQIVNLLPVAK